MSQEISISSNNNLIDWNCQAQLKTLKDIYAKKATPEEFAIFVNLGKATGLNPFLKEIWLLKYGSDAASIFIARDGYRKSAQSNPNYDYHLSDAVYSKDNFRVVNGEVCHEYTLSDRGILIGAYCIVKRRSSSKPNYVFVELKEYNKKRSTWNDIPATMIKKVAEAQCLRMAFQELFANTYHEDEYTAVDNSPQARSSRADSKVSQLIEGKLEKVSSVEELSDVISIIDEAICFDDLLPVASLAKKLSEEDRIIVRRLYKLKADQLTEVDNNQPKVDKASEKVDKVTGEINQEINEFQKIKNKLLKADSLDTLNLAADLIRDLSDEIQRTELTEIYTNRGDELLK